MGNVSSKMRFVYLFIFYLFVCGFEKVREDDFRNSKLSAVSLFEDFRCPHCSMLKPRENTTAFVLCYMAIPKPVHL